MIEESGPEPVYSKGSGFELWRLPELTLDYGRVLKDVDIAFETWGKLNADKSNAILLHTGLSPSSHARSHSKNTTPGWWEKFIGPGLSVDTNKFFVICTNVLGSCYGTTGPSSFQPGSKERYATNFPIITIHDMIRAQKELLVHQFGIRQLWASVGSSMGGMQSLAMARDYPEMVGRVVSVSGCARTPPSAIAMRYVQRQALMSDPHWNRGFYYDGVPPHIGMKMARQFATITYRSGPEWDSRFARDRLDSSQPPALCPDFLIETYLDHQGEKFCLQYDANSLLYISKAMDLFDLGRKNQVSRDPAKWREHTDQRCSVPREDYVPQLRKNVTPLSHSDLVEGMQPIANIPTFVLGVQSDVLFPCHQQQEICDALRDTGNNRVTHVELEYAKSHFGHDTFLIDVKNVGTPIKDFLEKKF